MQRFEVESSNIKTIGYSPAASVLEIEFHNGKIYQYEGVSLGDFENLRHAESVGKYFSANVKGKFQSREVPTFTPATPGIVEG